MPDIPSCPEVIPPQFATTATARDCTDCRLASLCLPLALDQTELAKLERIIKHRTIHKGAHIYRDREAFGAIYVASSGVFKGYRLADSGNEEVVGFYYPGEMLGVDGIATNHYASSALALEEAAVCVLQFDELNTLSLSIPTLQRRFFQLISQEIARDQQLISILGKSQAEQRVAALLHSLSIRNARRGLSAVTFSLPMTRAEMGSYLGLSTESVSRMLSQLQNDGVIAADGREIVVADLKRLRNVAGGCMECE